MERSKNCIGETALLPLTYMSTRFSISKPIPFLAALPARCLKISFHPPLERPQDGYKAIYTYGYVRDAMDRFHEALLLRHSIVRQIQT